MCPLHDNLRRPKLFYWLEHTIFNTDAPDLDNGLIAGRCYFTNFPDGALLVQVLQDFLVFLFVEELTFIFIASFGSAEFATPLDVYHSAHHRSFFDVFQFHFVQAGHDRRYHFPYWVLLAIWSALQSVVEDMNVHFLLFQPLQRPYDITCVPAEP